MTPTQSLLTGPSIAELQTENARLRKKVCELERKRDAETELFQLRVRKWMLACFTPEITADMLERCDRFIEEVFELVQALGYPQERIAALSDYTYGRPAGEPFQEVGGVSVTLAALCNAAAIDLKDAAETELARIWTKIEQIRAKQAAKPTGSALPTAQMGQSESVIPLYRETTEP